jgi:hypothetical protein
MSILKWSAIGVGGVLGLASRLESWQDWAAWTKGMDPEVEYTYSGPSEGVGATWAWRGPKMGKGRMMLTASDPQRGVEIDEAIESDEVNARGSLIYTRTGEGTRIDWRDSGTLPPVLGGYARGMINDMLGENSAVGLADLKRVVEEGQARVSGD